ncbi:MAG: FAD binding domain-containing protein [Verrucomicrobiota bacterium]
MKPSPFEYLRPSSLAETLEVLDRNGKDAKLIAGGQSLVPSLNFRETSCKILVDLSSIESFSEIEVSANQIRIGAMVRQSELDQNDAIKQRFPEFAALLPKVGFPATRNRGTIGGSIAWADPTLGKRAANSGKRCLIASF